MEMSVEAVSPAGEWAGASESDSGGHKKMEANQLGLYPCVQGHWSSSTEPNTSAQPVITPFLPG
jgi:hypothetical protein